MAVVQVNTNTLDFIFDNNIFKFELFSKISLLKCKKIYYIDMNNNYILLDDGEFTLKFSVSDGTAILPKQNVVLFNIEGISNISGKDTEHGFVKLEKGGAALVFEFKGLKWQLFTDEPGLLLKGIRVEDYTLEEGQTLATINEIVNPYIGEQTNIIMQIYGITVNGMPLKFVNGKAVKRIKDRIFVYELVERPSDELPDDTTLVFTANNTDIYSVSWYNEDTTQEIQVYLNDELIGASSESNATIDFPYSLVSGEQYRLTFKGGKLNIGGERWFISTNRDNVEQPVVSTRENTITEVIWGKNYGSKIYYLAFTGSPIETIKLPPSIRELVGDGVVNGVFSASLASSIILNEGLEIIGDSSFYGCDNLTTLTIPSSVKSVGGTALHAAKNHEITFMHTETDELTFATQIFNKPKNAVAMTIKHYGNPTVLNYNYATYNITPTFIDLREQQ